MDVERFDYVTQRDPQLRGLVLLPFAALFLLSGAWRLGALHLPGDQQVSYLNLLGRRPLAPP